MGRMLFFAVASLLHALATGESLAHHLEQALQVQASVGATPFTFDVTGITSLSVDAVVLTVTEAAAGTTPSLVVNSTYPATIAYQTSQTQPGVYLLRGYTTQSTPQFVKQGLATATLSVPSGQLQSLMCASSSYCTVEGGIFTTSSTLNAQGSATLIVNTQTLVSSYSVSSGGSSYVSVQTANVDKITTSAAGSSKIFLIGQQAAQSGVVTVQAEVSSSTCIQGPLFSGNSGATYSLTASASSQVALAGSNFGSGTLTASVSSSSEVQSCAFASTSASISATTSSRVYATVNGVASGKSTTSSNVFLSGVTQNAMTTSTSGTVSTNQDCVSTTATCNQVSPNVPNSIGVNFCPEQETSCSFGPTTPPNSAPSTSSPNSAPSTSSPNSAPSTSSIAFTTCFTGTALALVALFA